MKCDIPNRSTIDDIAVMSRLILQKIITSDAIKYLSKSSYEDLQNAFLSSDPTKDLMLAFELEESKSYYSKRVSFVHIRWSNEKEELIDTSGNVWLKKNLEIKPTLESDYSSNYDAFCKRMSCLTTIDSLLTEIIGMVPDGMNIFLMNNDQRIERDKKRAYDAACRDLAKIITKDKKYMRKNLRAGGSSRTFRKDDAFEKFETGRYLVTINDGSRYRQKNKTYTISFHDSTMTLRRIS